MLMIIIDESRYSLSPKDKGSCCVCFVHCFARGALCELYYLTMQTNRKNSNRLNDCSMPGKLMVAQRPA